MEHTGKQNTWIKSGCRLSLWLYVFVGIGFLLMGASESMGQLRVSQQGHLIDANRRVGSMGLNPTASREVFFPRINNLLMTGNVRGGKGFQGMMPYSNVGQINSSWSSSTLSNFRRDSTGVSDLSTGMVSPMRPYFDPSRSTTGTHRGQVMRSDQAFTPINSSKIPRSGFSGQRVSMAPINQRVLSGDSSISGLQADLGRALLSPRFNQGVYFPVAINPGLQPAAMNPAAPLSPTLKPLQPLDMRIQPDQSTGTGDLTDIQQIQQRFDEMNQLNQQQRSSFNRYQSSAVGTTAVSNPVNWNVFSGGGTTTYRSSSRSTILGAKPGSFRPTTVATSKSKVKVEKPPVGSDFLDYGRQLMKHRQYFQAVEAFDVAIQNNPAGGAGYLNKGHAQLAAGAFVSAAQNINQGIVLEPELVSTKINFSELFGDQTIFQQRLDELKQLQTKNPSLLFVKGYILYHFDLEGQAKDALEKAQGEQTDLTGIELLREAIGKIQE